MILLREAAKFLNENNLGSVEITIRTDSSDTEGLRTFDINKIQEYLKKANTTGKPVTRKLNEHTTMTFNKPKRQSPKRKKSPKKELPSGD